MSVLLERDILAPMKVDASGAVATLQDILAAQPDVDVAVVFGSATTQTLRNDSDVDVAVLTRAPMTLARKQALVAAVAVATGRAVDLVDLRTAGVHLIGVILRTGKRVVCREERMWAELVSRNLIDSADFLPYRDRILAERRQTWIR